MLFNTDSFIEASPASIPEEEMSLPVEIAGRNIVAVIPAFNEERFIGSVVLKTRKYARTVIVVDDGSVDATAFIAAEAGAVVLSHDLNQGKGAAMNTAFRMARDYQPDVVVTLDADGQHSPDELLQVVAPVLSGQADIVVGSRYLQKTSKVPRFRVVGHRAFNFITNQLSGVRVSDSQSGYRAFSPRSIDAITFHSKGFSVESEMQFIAQQLGLKLVEVSITIVYSDKPKRPAWAHGLMVLNGILRMVGQHRPLLFFGVPGAFLLTAGIGLGFAVVNIYNDSHILAVGYALLTVLMTITGTLSLFTGLMLHSIKDLLLSISQSKPVH